MKAVKMCGYGNDFLLFDICGVEDSIKHFNKIKNKANLLADRHFGVGCDQIIIVASYDFINNIAISDGTFFICFLNSDGSFSGACGNGTRCAADYLSRLTRQNKIVFQAIDRSLTCFVNGNEIEVEMGRVLQKDFEIPLASNINITYAKQFVMDTFNKFAVGSNILNGLQIADIFFGNIGNPHCVIGLTDGDFLRQNYDNLQLIDILSQIGRVIENSVEIFPQKINIEFAQQNSDKSIFFIVWERGAGITLSCGTGASVVGYFFGSKNNASIVDVASSGCLIQSQHYNSDVEFLKISTNKQTGDVKMTGGCKVIADIDIKLFME